MNEQRYIDLLKNVLTDYHRMEYGEFKPLYSSHPNWKYRTLQKLDIILRKWNVYICVKNEFKKENRENGIDWPSNAETMIGMKRLENIEFCIKKIIEDNIKGDLIETGVWRGGAVIFMKAILDTYGIKDRVVWAADSFEGLPKPNSEIYIADKDDKHYMTKELAIPLEEVKKNFKKYDLLDENVKFLKGWFKDTLPNAPISNLSLLRLDGDMYESTMDGLNNLYPKLSAGGFVIIDDWGAVPACKEAVMDYRTKHNIKEEIHNIDGSGVYWRKNLPI